MPDSSGFDGMTGEIAQDKIDQMIDQALMEDSGLGDLTSEAIFSEHDVCSADIICHEAGILAGLEVVTRVFLLCDDHIAVYAHVPDGTVVQPGMCIARVEGGIRGMLRAERVALNILQRMSGIATLTRAFVDAVAGTGVKITDTRKTAPGLRMFDKWAVRLGGGVNHRFGLDDMVLIKDNHVEAAGGITNAVRACQENLKLRRLSVPIEVETRNLAEVREAMQCVGVSRIMLDNLSVEDMRAAVELIDHKLEVEASGGMSLMNVRSYAETGVDFISVGALTHSPKALDISLEVSSVKR